MFLLNHSSSIVLKCSAWSIGGISSVPSDTNKDFPNSTFWTQFNGRICSGWKFLIWLASSVLLVLHLCENDPFYIWYVNGGVEGITYTLVILFVETAACLRGGLWRGRSATGSRCRGCPTGGSQFFFAIDKCLDKFWCRHVAPPQNVLVVHVGSLLISGY